MSKQLSPNTQEIFILIDERLMAAKNPKRSRHPRYFIVAAYSSKMKAEEAADGYLDALSFAPKGGSGQGWKQGKLTGEISKTTTSGKTNEKYGEVYATYRDDDAVLGHLRILKVNINRPPEDEIDYMTAEHFAGEMKSLVQTYVELRYPDDEEMQTALFENITSGKPSVSLEEIRDYVNARSAWYAESFGSEAESTYYLVTFEVRDGEREYLHRSIYSADAKDMSDKELIAEEWGEENPQDDDYKGFHWVYDEILVRVYSKKPMDGKTRKIFNEYGLYAETFNAPYAGAGALMDITKDTSLGNFTSKELTESSAIHGDFDHASLNYSGHQNIEARAESFSAETSKNALVLGTVAGEPAMMVFIQGKEDDNGFTTGRIIGCDSEEEVIEEAEKIRDAVGLERLKKSTQSWERNVKSHAESFGAEYTPLQTDTLICGQCDEPMERHHNAKWLENDYVCRACNHGYRFDGIWDYTWDDVPLEERVAWFEAESFSQWSQDEMNEPSHKGRKMEFDDWLDEEIESHGDIPLSEWGYEEEHDEPEHQHSESFNATKGIDTFAEPFEDLDDFYSGTKGAVKFVGLGVLVSVGIWMTKNKLLK
tara:strand:+ start:727 stop:2511 length:1785 start_codon:yes stop_codon:yes gene_type:complete